MHQRPAQRTDDALWFACPACGASAPWTTPAWRCRCGGPWEVARTHPPRPNPPALDPGRPPGLWRYLEVLAPFDPEDVVTLGEPLTPLVPVALEALPALPVEIVPVPGPGGEPGAAAPWGAPDGAASASIWLKVDGLLPTGSFKDRGVAMMVSHTRRLRLGEVFCDSSGNAGAALAAYAARAGIRCRVLVPAYASGPKVEQIAACGAEVVRVSGTREDVARRALEEAQAAEAEEPQGAGRAAYLSHNWHPLFLDGTKTLAYEIWEQMSYRAPDVFVAPMGYGSAILGAAMGFGELAAAGLIDRVPRLVGVQAAACAPVLDAARRGDPNVPGVPAARTLAEGVACARPVRGPALYRALAATGGAVVGVSEDTIGPARDALGRCGWYAEPTSALVAAAIPAVCRAGLVPPGGTAAALLTGHGLKAGRG